jgi:hypothetical protein
MLGRGKRVGINLLARREQRPPSPLKWQFGQEPPKLPSTSTHSIQGPWPLAQCVHDTAETVPQLCARYASLFPERSRFRGCLSFRSKGVRRKGRAPRRSMAAVDRPLYSGAAAAAETAGGVGGAATMGIAGEADAGRAGGAGSATRETAGTAEAALLLVFIAIYIYIYH